jgi:hypothetical protein
MSKSEHIVRWKSGGYEQLTIESGQLKIKGKSKHMETEVTEKSKRNEECRIEN